MRHLSHALRFESHRAARREREFMHTRDRALTHVSLTRVSFTALTLISGAGCNDLVAPEPQATSDLQVTTSPAAYQYTHTSANVRLPETPAGQWSALRAQLTNVGNTAMTISQICLLGPDGACVSGNDGVFRVCEGREAALDECAPTSVGLELGAGEGRFVTVVFAPPEGVVRAYDASLAIETTSAAIPKFYINVESSACRAASDGLTCLSADDRDGDGVSNAEDNCPDIENPDQLDSDNDGAGDACDAAPETANYKVQRGALPQAAGELKTRRYAVTGSLTAGSARSYSGRYSLTGRLAP